MDPEPSTQPASPWRQVNLTFPDWQTAEQHAATYLGPALIDAEDTGAINAFWFVRKAETWRLRLLRGDEPAHLEALLARITSHEQVIEHSQPLYEPETYAFGGIEGMSIAHGLFHADSRHILQHLGTGGDHRREFAVLLSTRLMRSAKLDFYEQGAVWQEFAAHRDDPNIPHLPPGPQLVGAVQRLITSVADAPRSPLHVTPAWPEAYERTGDFLAFLAEHGELGRGLRGVLVQHLLFAFNRLGVSRLDQHALAAAAAHVVFHTDRAPDTRLGTRRDQNTDPRMNVVTTDQNHTKTPDAAQLRDQLADELQQRGHLLTATVERAFRTVQREKFLPGVDLETIYTRRQIVTKRDESGAALSSASSPSLVADMLEQLDPQPGQRVLEIGAATGINAALLSELVGQGGQVVTIEIDQDLTDGARAGLARAGYPHVEVICGDGALGHPDGAPYDRIIVTAGAWDISTQLWDQLADDGRIVVPIRLHGSGLTRCLAFDRTGPDTLVATSALVCGFVPMRGSGEQDDDHVRLAADVVLKIDPADLPDRAALAGVLGHDRQETWTNIEVGDDDPIGHLDLYLLTHARQPFGRLGVGSVSRDNGLVTPAYRWAGAALYQGGTLAYVAFRPIGDTTQTVGVIAHGPDATKLAAELTDLLYRWNDAGRPNEATVTARRTGSGPTLAGAIIRPATTLTIEM